MASKKTEVERQISERPRRNKPSDDVFPERWEEAVLDVEKCLLRVKSKPSKKKGEDKDGAETKANEHVKERNRTPAKEIKEQEWRDWPVDTILSLDLSDKVKRRLRRSIHSKDLYVAFRSGNLTVVKLFGMANANLDMANKNGWTPIIHLSGTNSTDIVEYLLERRVSVNKPSHAGVTALNNAADTGQLAMVKLLCKWEASIEAAYNGQTPLWSASVSGHLDVVKFLSDQGASTGVIADDNGWTPLHAAARNGHLEVAKFLLGKGVPIDAPSIAGDTALCLAANEGHTNIAAFLISEGAHMTAATEDG
ncbi:unnamed protein product [Clonostachys solani]|uniref:Uncharacterized protein n=1 Tax=Clonostachys solani TaxID=160281 RepID=A0A9N9Z0H0_9HYPO|nr:unnamed protein product [Clonostachys solani]